MINWVLFGLLFFVSLVAYTLGNKKVLSPCFVVPFIFSLSALVLAVNTNYWNYEISINTLFTILFSIIFFELGFFCIKENKLKSKAGINNQKVLSQIKYPNSFFYLFIIFISLFTLALYFIQQRNNAIAVGMGGSIGSIISANRYMVDSQNQSSSLIRILISLVKVANYFLIFVYFYNRILFKKKKNGVFTFIISIIYLLCCFLSTSRVGFIYFFITLIFIVLFFITINKKRIIGPKPFLILVSFVLLAIFSFRYLGTFTGKTSRYSTYENLSIYFCGSIICFDKYLNGAVVLKDYSPLLFNGIYSILNRIGASISLDNYVLPHTYWGKDFGANIYTSFLPYYSEFGLSGLLLIEFAIGLFYGTWWKKIMHGNASLFSIAIFGYFFYILVYYPIAERFFSQIFTLTSIIELVFAYLFFSIVRNKKETIKVDKESGLFKQNVVI